MAVITMIAAIARNGAIGKDGTIPWHAPEDLRHFRDVTMGHAVVMGRKTLDSIGRSLPERLNIAITRNVMAIVERRTGKPPFDPEVCCVGSLREALECASVPWARECYGDDVFIIGGAQIYAEALTLADRLLITEVDIEVPDADTSFPFRAFGPMRPGFVWSEHEPPREFSQGVGSRYLLPEAGEFECVSRRSGEDPRLTFCEWRKA